jgi:hypothetical protein
MKNILLIFLLILAFGGCKDDDQPVVDSETKVEYDEWRKLPDSILNVGTIGIMALERRGGVVHINTEKRYYSLDTSLNALESRSMTTNGSWYQLWAPKYGNNYSISQIDALTFRVIDNIQATNNAVTYIGTNSLFDVSAEIVHWSQITADSRFYTVSTASSRDSLSAVLQEWKILHSPGSSDPIELEELSRVNIDSAKSAGFSQGYLKVYNFENRIIVNNGVDVRVYENGVQLAKYYFTLENLIMSDGIIYGGGNDRANLFDRDTTRSKGIVKSSDGGLSWEFTSLDANLDKLNYKSIDGQIFAFGQGGFGILKNDFSGVWPANTDGLFDMPRNLEKVGKYAMVGTDQGIYYKSWESFLNK